MTPSPDPARSRPADGRPTPASHAVVRRLRARSGGAARRRPTLGRIAKDGPGGLTVEAALKLLRKPELTDPYRFWGGEDASAVPAKVAEIREQLVRWMTDARIVAERVAKLSSTERAVLRAFLNAPLHRRRKQELEAVANGSSEGCVSALKRAGILFDDDSDDDAWVLPKDLAERVPRDASARAESAEDVPTGETFKVLTLKGHMENAYAGPGAARPMPAPRLREMFKMYANEAQAVARVERLPEGLRDLVGKVVLEFGGLLPKRFFERMETELPHWNQRRWAKILGESLVGTVARLDFTPYGIQHDDDTLVVFNELTLAWFKRVAVPSDPDAPHDACSLGVDLVANVSRFFAYLHDHAVRFTVKGEIFKTTEKRILTELIPNPGRELERAEVLQFIFQFARRSGFIEVTGERTFKLQPAGREFDEQPLETKLDALFEFVKRDIDVEHESIHHPAMRGILLKMMKRLEIGVWYDVMYLPFLARNAYIAQIEAFAGGLGAGSSTGASEDLQRLAWNLVSWVRKRLYLLGIVDLGYDAAGHPVAMRLTRIGARVLGLIDSAQTEADAFGLGRLIVTPDFEVMLFGDGDDADLVHDLDRFADRRSGEGSPQPSDTLRQFKLSDRSVHRGLVEGVTLQRMTEVLTANARTPVPQNVLQSMRGWAASAGLLVLGPDHVVRGSDPTLIARFVRDAGVRPFIKQRVDSTSVQLKSKTSRARYRTLLRDLDYLVELEG